MELIWIEKRKRAFDCIDLSLFYDVVKSNSITLQKEVTSEIEKKKKRNRQGGEREIKSA